MEKLKIALIGYGVIGKRVADAIALQDDMELTGVCDVINDWRIGAAIDKGYPVYAANMDAQEKMREVGIPLEGNMTELLKKVDLAVDCTPKKIAAQNVQMYKSQNIKFIMQGGEKHEVTGHSFSLENNYASSSRKMRKSPFLKLIRALV